MAEYKLISADSHVNEVADTWERVRRKYGAVRAIGVSSQIRCGAPHSAARAILSGQFSLAGDKCETRCKPWGELAPSAEMVVEEI